MKHESNDVKQLVTQIISYATKGEQLSLPTAMVKSLVPALVMGTKEKNSMVKSNSEYALVAILRLRKGDAFVMVSIARLCHVGHGFLKFSLILLNSERKLCGKVI